MLLSGKRLTAAVAAVLFAATLASCGGDDTGASDVPDASPSAAESPAQSPSSTSAESPAKPTLPEPTEDRAGRHAFAEYAVHAWEYGLVTNDYSAMAALDPADVCKGCHEMRGTLAERQQQGWHFTDPSVAISKTDDVLRKGRVRVVGMQVDTGRSKVVNDDGSVRDTNPATSLYFEVGMTFEGDHFQISDFSVGD